MRRSTVRLACLSVLVATSAYFTVGPHGEWPLIQADWPTFDVEAAAVAVGLVTNGSSHEVARAQLAAQSPLTPCDTSAVDCAAEQQSAPIVNATSAPLTVVEPSRQYSSDGGAAAVTAAAAASAQAEAPRVAVSHPIANASQPTGAKPRVATSEQPTVLSTEHLPAAERRAITATKTSAEKVARTASVKPAVEKKPVAKPTSKTFADAEWANRAFSRGG